MGEEVLSDRIAPTGEVDSPHSADMGGVSGSQATCRKHRDAETEVTWPSQSSWPAGDYDQ